MTKSRRGYILALCICLALCVIGAGSYTLERLSKPEPVKVMQTYLFDMEHMEPDQAASHVIDNRFLSQSALASFYEKDFQFERITSYKIVGYQQRDSSHAIVKVYATM